MGHQVSFSSSSLGWAVAAALGSWHAGLISFGPEKPQVYRYEAPAVAHEVEPNGCAKELRELLSCTTSVSDLQLRVYNLIWLSVVLGVGWLLALAALLAWCCSKRGGSQREEVSPRPRPQPAIQDTPRAPRPSVLSPEQRRLILGA